MKKTAILLVLCGLLVLTACGKQEPQTQGTTTTAQQIQTQSQQPGTETQRQNNGGILRQDIIGTLESKAILDVEHGMDITGTIQLTGQGFTFTHNDSAYGPVGADWTNVRMIVRDDDTRGMIDVKFYTDTANWDFEIPSTFVSEMANYLHLTVDD